MATKYTSKLQSLRSAEQYVDGFSGTSPEIQYIFIGNSIAYSNEASPPQIVESISENTNVDDSIIAGKRVLASDVNLVIPRVNWTADTKYRQFDDRVSIDDSISGVDSQNLKPMYVMTSDNNVYKCLSNNSNSAGQSPDSTVEPTGDYTTSNGVIATADGYIWKYMYQVRSGNKFLNSSHIPVPTRNVNATETDTTFNLDTTGVVEGELTTIVVTDGGTGYRNFSNVTVDAFEDGQTVIGLSSTIIDNTSLTAAGIAAANMSVSGTGIASNALISSVDSTNATITLTEATTANGGDTGNNLTITTRVFIDGDGSDAAANVTLTDGAITKVTVDTIGTGYEKANALIFGTGSGVVTRSVLAPKFGHAHHIGKDLAANSVMVATKIGDIDSTENGVVPLGIDFRQIGLLRNPHKYGESSAANNSTANTVISQVHRVTVSTGSSYQEDEFVYQGASNTVFSTSARVHRVVSSSIIELTDVVGTLLIATDLVGDTSGASRTITSITTPEFEPRSADILYVENITPVTRVDGQAEDIRLVLQF